MIINDLIKVTSFSFGLVLWSFYSFAVMSIISELNGFEEMIVLRVTEEFSVGQITVRKESKNGHAICIYKAMHIQRWAFAMLIMCKELD